MFESLFANFKTFQRQVTPQYDPLLSRYCGAASIQNYGLTQNRGSRDRSQIADFHFDLAKPKSWMEATSTREVDGSETPIPTYERHLLCDEDGAFPVDMKSGWEIKVLMAEMKRKGFQAWYRNPSRSSQDSLGIAYAGDGNQVRIVRPDFIFFAVQSNGTVVADIVDPHGPQFSDALPKLQGLAKYAETHAHVYRRIEAVAAVDDTLRVLDLTNPTVRKAVAEAKDAKSLYVGPHANNY